MQPHAIKKATLGLALAAGLTLSGLPGLASADGGSGQSQETAPAVQSAHELDVVNFTYQKIDASHPDNEWKYISIRRY